MRAESFSSSWIECEFCKPLLPHFNHKSSLWLLYRAVSLNNPSMDQCQSLTRFRKAASQCLVSKRLRNIVIEDTVEITVECAESCPLVFFWIVPVNNWFINTLGWPAPILTSWTPWVDCLCIAHTVALSAFTRVSGCCSNAYSNINWNPWQNYFPFSFQCDSGLVIWSRRQLHESGLLEDDAYVRQYTCLNTHLSKWQRVMTFFHWNTSRDGGW